MAHGPSTPRPRRRGALALLAALLGGCAPPPPPQVEALAFPVLVLFESGVVRHDDPADLRTMSVQRVVNAHQPPFLVDSRFDIYRLEQLQSVHGGLWLMANPSGPTEVSFALARVAQDDAEQARALIAARVWAIREGSDPAAAGRLAQAETFAQMLEAIGQ
jgi:hypothetical protein